jgi:two-component system, NtrC family, response regulator AtoC
MIEPQHLPNDMVGIDVSLNVDSDIQQDNFSIPAHTQRLEKKLITEAIANCNGNKAKAAKLLEISERSLWYKLESYNLK